MGIQFEIGLDPRCLLRFGSSTWLHELGVRGRPLLLSRGRDCLYVITKMLNLQPGDGILLPAFICAAVTDLIQDWGFEVALYGIERDLSVSLDQVKACINQRVKAIVYVNYFGYPQPASMVSGLRELGLPLIEDSCQSPFALGEREVEPDFAFTSLRKWLPVPDGAVLDVLGDAWQEDAAQIERRMPVNRNLVIWRTMACSVRRCQEHHDRRMLSIVAQELFAMAERALRSRMEPNRMSLFSKHIAARCDITQTRRRRYENHTTLISNLGGLHNIKLVLSSLPETGCPYGCPILVPNNRLWRDALRERGTQAAILWDCSHHWGDFPESQWLAQHLLVLPVAQTNTTDEMRQVCAVLREYDGD